MSKLTDKQRLFVAEYLVDLNAAAAARRAGYSEKTADRIGHQNLRKLEIQAAIQEAMNARAERVEITADRVLEELARLGFSDMRRYASWGPSGVTLHDSEELGEGDSACVSEVSMDKTIRYDEDGEPVVNIRTKFKLHDKLGALRDLGKHLGIFGKDGGGVNVNVNVNNGPPAKPLSDFTDAELDFYERLFDSGENVPNH